MPEGDDDLWGDPAAPRRDPRPGPQPHDAEDLWGGPRPSPAEAAPDEPREGSPAGLWDAPTQPRGRSAASRRARVSGPLLATLRERIRFAATARATLCLAVVVLVLALAAGGWMGRSVISSALSGILEHPSDPAPSATPTPSPGASVDREALAVSRSRLDDAIARGVKARAAVAEGTDTSDLDTALSVAREVAQGSSAQKMEAARTSLLSAIASLPTPSPTPDATTPAPTDPTPTPTHQSTTTAPQQTTSAPAPPATRPPATTPAPTPTRTVESLARVSVTATCTGDAVVTFHATGGGTVTVTVAGSSRSGQGSASLAAKIRSGGSLTARASATGSVRLWPTWETANGTCS